MSALGLDRVGKQLAVFWGVGLLLSAGMASGCGDDSGGGQNNNAVDAGGDLDAGDPCDSVDCSGHGTCSQGVCQCDPGYTGDLCDSCAVGYVPSGGDCVPDGSPCPEGVIGGACVCGPHLVDRGYCCSEVWFDPLYEQLTGGCPSDPFFYVDPSHASADDANPGSEDLPWLTLAHAAATLTAGQTVIVRGGTYAAEPNNTRYDPVFNPAHSGAAGQPIVFKGWDAVPPVVTSAPHLSGTAVSGSTATVELDSAASTDADIYEGYFVRIVGGAGAGQYRRISQYDGPSRTATVQRDWDVVPDSTSAYVLTAPGPLLGTLDRQHVVWDGFRVVEQDSYHPDTGPVVGWASDDVAFVGNLIEGQTVTLFDNHNGLRLEGSTRIHVRNNEIQGQQAVDVGDNNPQNHAAVMIYTSSDCIFEHNEIHDAYSGFFPKGGDSGHVFRYNVVHDCAKAFRVSYHTDVDIHQNLIYGCTMALQPAENNANVRFYNNVSYDNERGVYNWFAVEGFTIFNNLFVDTVSPFNLEGAVGTFVSDYNLFFGFTDFVAENSNVGGLAGWQGWGFDANSIEADPQVVDAAAWDFHLQAGSPAETGGIDWADFDDDADTTEAVPMGLYVTGDEHIGRYGPW